jgi:hypothetical protein
MLRKLLAILVLVTGLAAAGTPAQALSLDVESVRVANAPAYSCAAQPGTTNPQLRVTRERDEAAPKQCPRPPKIVLIVPTVMLHADRARE